MVEEVANTYLCLIELVVFMTSYLSEHVYVRRNLLLTQVCTLQRQNVSIASILVTVCCIMLLDVKMSDAKKRKKSYYCQAKRQCGSRQMLDVGLKGFLVTCNRMEKQTVREAYNVLNEYSSKLYGEVLLYS